MSILAGAIVVNDNQNNVSGDSDCIASNINQANKDVIEVLLSALSARIVVCVALLQGNLQDQLDGMAMLNSLLKQLPTPTPKALEIARYSLENIRNADGN